jgi:hypothetical protein
MSKTLGIKDGDFDFDVYGRPVFVEGPDKTSQDLAEILLSTYDATRDYGTNLTPGFVPPVGGEAVISMELTTAVERLQSLQASDTASTADERISSIVRLDVNGESDRTSYDYNLAVRTETGNSIINSDRVSVRRMSFGHLTQKV